MGINQAIEAADLVILGGAVYTMDAARRWARAVAVRGGRIVAVGSDREVRGLVGSRTEVVELAGGMLLPGFQDSHAHPVSGGYEQLRCDLTGEHSLEGYLRVIGGYAAGHPEAAWIVGGGWSMDVFPGGTPGRRELDAVVADRPVFLFNRDHHGAWVNSRALALAGIDRRTLDPAHGRIEREADGEPLGTLHEAAMDLVGDLAPKPTRADLAAALRRAQRYLHSLGITAWQDAAVGGPLSGEDTLPIYQEAEERGELTARVVGSLWWERDQDESQLGELQERRARTLPGGRFQASTVKIMQDGVCEDFTAAMLAPYLDGHGRATENRGMSFVDPEALKRYVTLLDRAGFQVHFHALGDRAVRESLDAVEAARGANGPNDLRPHLAHIQVVHPDDLPRFRALGAVANGQPLWARNEPQMTELTIPFLGPERSAQQYPFGSLVRHGATVAFGSDWPVSSPDPLAGIHTAVNRTPVPGEANGNGDSRWSVEPFLPEERLDLPTALFGYTMGAAFVNHLEREAGSIEVGKLADLVVLDRNLFELPPEEITTARVQATFVDGRKVYEQPGRSSIPS